MVIFEFSTRSGTHVVSPSKGTKATPVILSGCRVITHENKAIHSLVLQLLRNTPYSLKINVFLTNLLTYNHKRQSRGSGQGFRSPPQHKYGGAEPLTFWYGKTLLRRYFTIPVTSATSKRTFSALRRLKNYLRSTTKQDRLNN